MYLVLVNLIVFPFHFVEQFIMLSAQLVLNYHFVNSWQIRGASGM